MPFTAYGFSDSQAQGCHAPHYEGWVPETRFPYKAWLSGPSLAERPISAPPGTFYVIEGVVNQVWIWLHPHYQMGPFADRPSRARPGYTYYATDMAQLFVWED